jgi:AraC-like DNA-binding protein
MAPPAPSWCSAIMNSSAAHAAIEIREHRLGRFDRRMPSGPARWDFHDLLWIHEGAVKLAVSDADPITLTAPNGILILPDTPFEGAAIGGYATASICHFDWPGAPELDMAGPGHCLPRHGEALHIQAMLRLSLDLARRRDDADLPRRQRLLSAILDCFALPSSSASPEGEVDDTRLALAWVQAEKALAKMRTLSDVAALMGVQESALRARHRRQHTTSAGGHLREMRLRKAEDLLTTTRFSMDEIARHVGYGHAETLIAAFHKSRGCTPGEFRHRSNPFA